MNKDIIQELLQNNKKETEDEEEKPDTIKKQALYTS